MVTDGEVLKQAAIVEYYIFEKTGKRVKIVFDNPMSIRKHLKMLYAAHEVAANYNKTK